jgi:hypothetical protein
MKKLVAILTVMVIGTLSANAAGLVWGTSTAFAESTAPDIVKADGSAMSVGDGYYMYLFLDGAPSVAALNNLNSSAITETPIATINGVTEYWDSLLTGEDGVFFYDGYNSVTDTPDVTETYTALMISDAATSTIAGAYEYILFSDLAITQTGPPTPSFDYKLGEISQGDWTAIPEPSTMLLGGIGLLGLWIRRRMSK